MNRDHTDTGDERDSSGSTDRNRDDGNPPVQLKSPANEDKSNKDWQADRLGLRQDFEDLGRLGDWVDRQVALAQGAKVGFELPTLTYHPNPGLLNTSEFSSEQLRITQAPGSTFRLLNPSTSDDTLGAPLKVANAVWEAILLKYLKVDLLPIPTAVQAVIGYELNEAVEKVESSVIHRLNDPDATPLIAERPPLLLWQP